MSTKDRVGYVGVGLMGHPAAENILRRGFSLTILAHRNRVPVDDLVAKGAAEAPSPTTMADAAHDVLTDVLNAGHGHRYIPRLPGIMAAMAGASFRSLEEG